MLEEPGMNCIYVTPFLYTPTWCQLILTGLLELGAAVIAPASKVK